MSETIEVQAEAAKPETKSLLAEYRGEKPPAAAWFSEAVAQIPARSTFSSGGVEVELLTWGEAGKPGLLFLHGNGAHADWWSFIAPFFAADYRCAAISWPGMGGSGWRAHYTIEQFAVDALRAIEVAALDRGPVKPLVVAHSFGGVPLIYLGAEHADRLTGGIMIDSFAPPPNRRPGWTTRGAPTRRYATIAEALARFRFAPEQDSAWPEIVDHIARRSLHEVPADAEGPAGWTWRFDPQLWANLERTGADAMVGRVGIPMALIFGEQSLLVRAETAASMQARLPDCPISIAIPGARHHIMVDEPIALIVALRVAIQGITALAGQGRAASA
jgi:pimeloyl-ACP methyl ester carboxylesterase